MSAFLVQLLIEIVEACGSVKWIVSLPIDLRSLSRLSEMIDVERWFRGIPDERLFLFAVLGQRSLRQCATVM